MERAGWNHTSMELDLIIHLSGILVADNDNDSIK